MKKMIWIACFLFVFSVLTSGCNVAKNSATAQDKDVVIDKNYLLALNTINNFSMAWLNRDYVKGVELLSEKTKNSVPLADLKMFFSGLSNPHHQGFEVIGKEQVDENTIKFQVWFYEYYTGEKPAPTERPEPQSIDVIKVNEDTWLVNNLPE